MSKSKRKDKVSKLIKLTRKARRDSIINLQIPQEKHKVHRTHKKDVAETEPNTIKVRDIEGDVL